MYSCPFRRCQFFGFLSLHWRTNNYRSWEYGQGVFCFTKYAWKRSFVGGTTRSCLGALGSHGSSSTYLIFFFRSVYMPQIFILSWPLALQMGLARRQIRWEERDEEARWYVLFYSQNLKLPFWHCFEKSRLWYTKSFKWIIIGIPRNIVCLIVFYLKYVPGLHHFEPPHLK